MTAIAAGKTATFTIPVGQVAQVTGSGIAVLLNPVSSPSSIVNSGIIGPFGYARVVMLSASSNINYVVVALTNTASTSTSTGGAQAVITGTYTVGSSLTAVPSNGYSFTAGQWLRNGAAISGETGLSYLLQLADGGTVISFIPTSPSYVATGQTVDAVPAAATPLIAAPTTIGVAATYTSSDAITSQQWTLDGADVAGATTATYTQLFADAAKVLRVRTTSTGGAATSLPVLPGLQNLRTSNTVNLRAMLAGGGGTIIGCGDSAMSGFTSGGAANETNMRANSYLAKLVAGLVAAGYPASKDSAFGTGQATTSAGYALMDPRWTFTTGVPVLSGYPTLGGLMFGMRIGTPTDMATFTPGTPFDTVDVYSALSAAAGSVLVSVDGGVTTLATISNNNSTAGILKTTVTVPAGSTAVSFKSSNAGGTGDPYISGVKTRVAATPKIEIINGALTGTTVLANATGTATTGYRPRNTIAQLAVGVTRGILVLNGWYNDKSGSQTVDQVIANYKILCDDAVARGWDIWFVSYPALNAFINATDFNAYELPIIAYLRDTYNAVIFQESKIITDYSTYYNLGYYGDALHINGLGHQKIADSLTAMCKLAVAGTLPA